MWRDSAIALARSARRFLLLILIVTGAVCGLAAVAFHHLVELMHRVLIEPAIALPLPWRIPAVLLVPALVSMLLVRIVKRFAPAAGSANLARVRRAYETDLSVLDTRTVAATLALTPISLGAGAPLGPEGPTVVVSSGIAVALARYLRLPKKVTRGMIPVGTAAGIAAIFNTPITGVVFALEEVMGSAGKGVLGGTIVAAVAAAVVERKLLGGEQLLSAPHGSWSSVMELAGFLLSGLIAGVVSGAAILAVRRLRPRIAKVVRSATWRAGIGGFAIGAIGLMVPAILGVGYDTTSLLLHSKGTLDLASASFFAKTVAFIIALSTGILGGVFAPSLFIGAALGATIGHSIAIIFPSAPIDPGAYALVGMGAFFAGFLRCPISAVLIVVEVTGDYELILPLMLAVAVATSLSRRLAPHSLTELQMMDEGVHERSGAVDPLDGLLVADVMSKEPVAIDSGTTLIDAARTAAGLRHRIFPVVDEERRVVGILDRDAIDEAAREGQLEQAVATRARATRLLLRSNDVLLDAIRDMARHGVDRCAVVDRHDRLAGILSPRDILSARMRAAAEDTAHGGRGMDALMS